VPFHPTRFIATAGKAARHFASHHLLPVHILLLLRRPHRSDGACLPGPPIGISSGSRFGSFPPPSGGDPSNGPPARGLSACGGIPNPGKEHSRPSSNSLRSTPAPRDTPASWRMKKLGSGSSASQTCILRYLLKGSRRRSHLRPTPRLPNLKVIQASNQDRFPT